MCLLLSPRVSHQAAEVRETSHVSHGRSEVRVVRQELGEERAARLARLRANLAWAEANHDWPLASASRYAIAEAEGRDTLTAEINRSSEQFASHPITRILAAPGEAARALANEQLRAEYENHRRGPYLKGEEGRFLRKFGEAVGPSGLDPTRVKDRGAEDFWAEMARNTVLMGTVMLAGEGVAATRSLLSTGKLGSMGTIVPRSAGFDMRSVRQRWWGGPTPVRPNPVMPRGCEFMELSHTYIPDKGWGSVIRNSVKNRGWNLKPMWGSEHALVDPQRYQFMSPAWRAGNRKRPAECVLRAVIG